MIVCESVGSGHPDKIADQISDGLITEYLKKDPNSLTAIETMVKDNVVIIAGEVNSNATINYEKIIKKIVKGIGFNSNNIFYYKNLTIINLIGQQSLEINKIVDKKTELGAGDQGFVTGYANNKTENYMPIGMYITNKIVNYLSSNSKKNNIGPDCKSQVILNDEETKIEQLIISTMHNKNISLKYLNNFIKESLLQNKFNFEKKIHKMLLSENYNLYINDGGEWNIGGPQSDCGLTGRKIVVDQYGSYCTVGGGAFSGKDGSKCDRSGAYLARYIAKNLVASGIMDECKVELSYMIGKINPISIKIIPLTKLNYTTVFPLEEVVKKVFDLSIQKNIENFNLKHINYLNIAKNGHFGLEYPWEKLDKVDKLKYFINL